jgi:1,4-dihydroxy-2-naphthoyl-CoA hydrolase
LSDATPWLLLQRTVRFGDTDAAGVMHFHQLLRWCHEAYEESLEHFGIPASVVFPTPNGSVAVALPIIHCSADFLRPLVCGDNLSVQLTPQRLDQGRFEVSYSFHRGTGDTPEVARGLTRHLAIDTGSRRRCPLPAPIERWLQQSSLAAAVGLEAGQGC